MGMSASSFVKRVVGTCLGIGKGDRVSIFTWRHTLDLAEALAIECVRAGAQIHMEFATDEIFYDRLSNSSLEYLKTPNPFAFSVMDLATAFISISGPEDPERLKQVSADRWNAAAIADKPYYDRFSERKIRSATILLGLVTPQRAKTYGFNYREWKENAHDALDVKYKDMQRLGQKLKDLLEKAKQVHIKAPNGTDLTFNLGDRPIHIYDGVIDKEDIEEGAVFVGLPDGSVRVAPLETSAKGTFISDVPEAAVGVLVHEVRWDFRDGKLVAFRGGKNVGVIKEMWKKGTGDKSRIGMFVLGINPRAKVGFTHNPIVLGTATIGIGENAKIGGENDADWSFHATIAEPTVELDGKLILKKGKFRI